MAKYKFPFRIPDGWRLIITTPFTGADKHNGVDVAVMDDDTYEPEDTYGIPLVWPFPFPGKPYEIHIDSPVPGQGKKSRVQVDGTDPATGVTYSVIDVHASGSPYFVSANTPSTIVFKQGDVIAFVGNNGAVSPKPTKTDGFAGSHAHLALGVKRPGMLNAVNEDPMLYFDLDDPFRGPDDPSRDKPIYEWMGQTYKFTREMGLRTVGEDVRELQKRLGMSQQTGYYGYLTFAYVALFQWRNGIPATGYVGPLTLAVLNK